MHSTPRVLFLALVCATNLGAQITLVDDLNRSVSIPSAAQRIVSLAPSITESLFAIGAGSRVVGVTDYCNYPLAAKSKEQVGGVINPNIEKIVSLRPDLILLTMEGNVREDFNKLTSFGVPVFVTNPRTLQGIRESIAKIGSLAGREEEAARLVYSMKNVEDSVKTLTQKAVRPRVLFFVSLQPIIVVGTSTFLNELIELAGGVNIAASTGSTYPTYSREVVLENNPDVLIFMSEIIQDTDEITNLYPEWSKLNAVLAGKVFTIDADVLSRPGPRAVNGLRALFHLLHPQHQ
ncbi:MAG: cobalamin-binding protein [Ignavibacteriae bacterium]|nr:cobalamin-binding protein [Ignavibacteriota bacterium]